MEEWLKVVGLGVFLAGAIIIVDKFSGATGHVISNNLGEIISPIIGMVAIFAGVFLMFIRHGLVYKK